MAERNDNYFYLSRLPNCLGWIHNELQYFNRAREHNQRGAEIAHQGQILEAEANSLINLGYDYTHTGESDKPPAVFREVEAIFARDDWMRWRYNIRLQAGRAEYHLAQGNLEQAREYAERLLETASHYEAHKYIAVAHKLFAEVAIKRGDLTESKVQLGAALDELRAYPSPLVAWKTYAALGRLHLRLGE